MNRTALQARRIKNIWKIIKLDVLASGGFSRVLRRARRIRREEGTEGLRRAWALLVAQDELSPEEGGFRPDDYTEWIRRYDTLSQAADRRLRHRLALLPEPSRFSLVLLPGASESHALDRTLRTLRGQIFDRWELIAAPESDPGLAARRVLARHAEADARIRRIDSGQTAAATTLDALECAEGSYVGFLRAGDELPSHALFCAAQRLSARPDAILLYADEDRVDAAGGRSRPWFKPDVNPELMLEQDMFSGLCLLRTRAAVAVGGVREGFGPWMIYDLAWRVLDASQTGAAGATHVPRVLFHRRWSPVPSDSAGDDMAAGRRAAQEHLDRVGKGARALPAPGVPGCIRVLSPRPAPETGVSILIPTHDRADLLSLCVGSILAKTKRRTPEIIVIANGSSEAATLRRLDELAKRGVRIVRDDGPFDRSRLSNAGAAAASGEYLCLLRDDVEILDDEWLDELLSFAQKPDVGCVGARLLYPDGTLRHGGILRGVCGLAGPAHLGLGRGETGYFGRAALPQEMSAVAAACLVVRRAIFERVGGLDEALPESYADLDFCLRVRAAGYRNIWTPYAELLRRDSADRNSDADPAEATRRERRAALLMRTRWGALAEDPAYNPNLTRRACDFGLAWPPRNAPLSLL